MEFWMSGEIQADVADSYREAPNGLFLRRPRKNGLSSRSSGGKTAPITMK